MIESKSQPTIKTMWYGTTHDVQINSAVDK